MLILVAKATTMPKRNSPQDIKELDDINRLHEIVRDKRNDKRAEDKKSRRNRHYEKQFIKNTIANLRNWQADEPPNSMPLPDS